MTCVRVLLFSLLVSTAAQAQQEAPPPHVKAAMQGLWRRGSCLLSSVYKPAARESTVPKDIGRTPVLSPRLFGRNDALLCYAVDGQTIWAADDQSLYQVDGAAGKLIKRFDSSDGLPDGPIQSISPVGDNIWLVSANGLARLQTKTGKIATLDEIPSGLARVAAGPSGLWLVGDRGAYHLSAGAHRWRKLPQFPGQKQLAQIAHRGYWTILWRKQTSAVIGSMLATRDGLYVICLNRLLRYEPDGNEWRQISDNTWEATLQGRTVWALTTAGVMRYDPATGKSEQFRTGSGLASGRPVAIAATSSAVFVASRPDYDSKVGRFVGGGISRLDAATGKWTITEKINGTDIRFVSVLLAHGDHVCAACTLYDKVVQLGAHPGMAHVKRWRPHETGLGLLRYDKGNWTIIKGQGLATDRRWVMGQKGTVKPDRIAPKSIEAIYDCGDRIWASYRMVPQRYYAGYYISAGCLATRANGRWKGRFDIRTNELGLAGEQPELMLISHSHGVKIVLAEGHPVVLGIEHVAGKTWVICESGLFVHEAAGDRFRPVVRARCRMYWRATAAAAGRQGVWIGGDEGTISRLDGNSARLELVGVVPGRKIVSVAVEGRRVVVRTAKADVALPVALKSAAKLPAADCLVFDGAKWSPGPAEIQPSTSAFSCRKKSNYLYKGDRRIAFLKGVFRPKVLCEDPRGGRLWLGTYSGIAGIPLPAGSGN